MCSRLIEPASEKISFLSPHFPKYILYKIDNTIEIRVHCKKNEEKNLLYKVVAPIIFPRCEIHLKRYISLLYENFLT